MQHLQHLWRLFLSSWRFDTPLGVISWQSTLNTTMLAVVIGWHPQPWLALIAMLGLLAASCWLHGRGHAPLILLYAVLGFVGELWMTNLGPVWVHSAPTACAWGGLSCGALLGVPLFMLPAWGLIGALMLALLRLWPARA